MADAELMALDEIKQRVQLAREFTSGWHSNIKRWRNWYKGKHYETKPKSGEDRYVDPTPCNAVDLAVGILQSNEMVWSATGLTPSARENKGSSLVEKTMAGIIATNERRKEVNLKYETDLNFVRDGGAVIYTAWDDEIHGSGFEMRTGYGDTEESLLTKAKVFYELPLRIENVDPLSILLLPGGVGRWLAIGRMEDMSVYDVERIYGIYLPEYKELKISAKIDHKGEFLDWWDWTWVDEPDADYAEEMSDIERSAHTNRKLKVRNSLLYEGEFIRPPQIMEGYTKLAYSVRFYNPASTSDSTMWQSLIAPQESSIRELEQATNMRKRLLAIYSAMPMVARTREGKPVKIDPALGKVIPMRNDEDLGFPKWEGTPPDFDKQIELYRSRIQQSGFSDVMYGEGASSVSGYALSQLGDQNRIRLTPAISHLEDLWSEVAEKSLSLISTFASDAYLELYGNLRGADFAEAIPGNRLQGYKVRCKIKPDFPNERVRNHAMATQAAGVLSARRLMEDYYGIQQSDDERTQKLIESMEDHPLAIQYSMMLEFKKIMNDSASSMEEKELAGYMLNLLQTQLQVNQGGRPTEPNNPQQMLGTQTPTGGSVPTNQPSAGSQEAMLLQNLSGMAANMNGQVQ